MTAPVVIADRVGAGPHRLVVPWLVVLVARVVARRRPVDIRRFMVRARGSARPATVQEAARARELVVRVNTLCAGEGCLLRSIATALLCRAHGSWPTWCSGVRVLPFLGHAWVEVDGVPVGEPYPPGYHRALIRVPAAGTEEAA